MSRRNPMQPHSTGARQPRTGLALGLLLFCVAPAVAAPIGEALGWHELPDTRLRPHCPSAAEYPDVIGSGGCNSVTEAWGGAAFDTDGNRMLLTGGGHADWGGNEVYELDLDSGMMRRLNNPSYPIRDGCLFDSVYVDGRPVSRHTYNHLEYLPDADLLFLFGGSRWYCGYFGDDTWTFDPALDSWTQRSDVDAPDANFGTGTVRDPVSGLIYAHDVYRLRSYDPVQHTWSIRSNNPGSLSAYKQAVIDPVRRRYLIYTAGTRRLYWYDISASSGMLTMQTLDTLSCSFMDEDAAGWVYEPQLDRLVAWNDGDSVQLLNPDTGECSTQTFPGGPTATATGTYGRFRYAARSGVILSCNRIDDNCFVLRLVPSARVFANGFE